VCFQPPPEAIPSHRDAWREAQELCDAEQMEAEILAAQIAGETPPLERELLNAMHPARFIIRDLKRSRI
jgi:hypothetical protein